MAGGLGGVSQGLLCPLQSQAEVANLEVDLKDLGSLGQPPGMVPKNQSPQPARSGLDLPPGIAPGQQRHLPGQGCDGDQAAPSCQLSLHQRWDCPSPATGPWMDAGPGMGIISSLQPPLITESSS